MDLHLLIDNLSNPALLFFFLGVAAVQLKSDLVIPENSSKFISLYLLFAIGFKGGQELAHSDWGPEIYYSVFFGLVMSLIIPIYTYFLLRKITGEYNAAAIAAAYGSVSAVTFVTSISFLELHEVPFGGHMVAVMALMEAPAIIAGIFVLNLYKGDSKVDFNEWKCLFPPHVVYSQSSFLSRSIKQTQAFSFAFSPHETREKQVQELASSLILGRPRHLLDWSIFSLRGRADLPPGERNFCFVI